MHIRLFYLMPLSYAATAEEARQYAFDHFDSESVGADWWVVGGRFSGHLTIFNPQHNAVRERINALWETYHNTRHETVEAMKRDLQRIDHESETLYQTLGNGLPFERDAYQELGYADDAMVVEDWMLRYFVEDTEGDGMTYYQHVEGTAPSTALVGTHWVVVIDYHW